MTRIDDSLKNSGVKHPFFYYYGGKWRIAKKYPGPIFPRIIEPFAGAAGYSSRYYQKEVLLCDLDPIIAGLWKYLLKSSPNDIMSLPTNISHVDELSVCQEAKWLIGFFLN